MKRDPFWPYADLPESELEPRMRLAQVLLDLARTDAREPVVYFIQCGDSGPVKIGQTRNVLKRLAELQSSHHETLVVRCALPLVDGLEAHLHRSFEAQRIRGEWFRFEGGLVEFLEEAKRTGRGALDPETCP